MRRIIFGSVLILQVLAMTPTALAADGVPALPPPPVKIPGPLAKANLDEQGHTVFTTYNGNTFALYEERGKIISGFLNLQEVENTCDAPSTAKPVVLAQCKLGFSAFFFRFSARWTQNSIPNKVGQLVQLRLGSQEDGSPKLTPVQTSGNAIGFTWFLNQEPQYKNQFPLDTISCDNWDWAGAPSGDANSDFIFQSLVREEMSQTVETGINENQGIVNAFDVHLHPKSGGVYEIATRGPITPSLQATFGFPPYFAQQTLLFNYLNKKSGQLCQVTFAVSTDKSSNLDDPKPYLPDPSTLQLTQGLLMPIFGFEVRTLLDHVLTSDPTDPEILQ